MERTGNIVMVPKMNVQPNNIDLNEMISLINSSRWTIISSVVAALLIAVVYLGVTKPEYRADALLQVEDDDKRSMVFSETSDVKSSGIVIGDKIEILKSRSVLDKVVGALNLDIIANPVYLPVIGESLARWISLDIGDYASGNEIIDIEEFTVPESYLNKEFTLVVTEGNGLKLFDFNGKQLGAWNVREPLEIALNNNEIISLRFKELSSRPGKSFRIMKKQRLKAIADLKSRLEVEESKGARGFAPKAGLINIALTGVDAEKTAKTLNMVIDTFLAQNFQQKTTNTNNVLAYLETQLKGVSKQLVRAESTLNNYRLQKGSVDITKETATVLDGTVDIESKLSELKRERDDLLQLFTPTSPKVAAVDAKIAGLNMELNALNQRIRALPEVQQEVLRLTRDVELSRTLYTILLKKTQELRIVKDGLVDDISIIDYAVTPTTPESPKKNLVIALSVVLGVLLGMVRLIASRALYGGVEDPDLIESQLGLDVFAVVPNSGNQKRLGVTDMRLDADRVLAATVSDDMAIESLRNLRTVLDFKRPQLKNNIVLVTGPSPGVGKSFVASNLGVLWANTNKKVLLVDADLRRGSVHHYFGAGREFGLSNSVLRGTTIKDSIVKTKTKNLYILPAGICPDKPSDLFLESRLNEMLMEFSALFDHVIIDAPPVLGLSDASVLAQKAGITILVIKEGTTTLRETRQAVRNLQQSGVTPDGVVFNNMQITKNRYGYGRYYGYSYERSED